MAMQGDLFGDPKPARPTAALEVHEHSFIRGARSHWAGTAHGRLAHSHEGGAVPHQHPETGPACYTIDKDEWFRETGLRGGGRKKFTETPTGEQFPIVDLEDWQKSFEIIIGPPAKGQQFGDLAGPGVALPLRLIKSFGMTVAAIKSREG